MLYFFWSLISNPATARLSSRMTEVAKKVWGWKAQWPQLTSANGMCCLCNPAAMKTEPDDTVGHAAMKTEPGDTAGNELIANSAPFRRSPLPPTDTDAEVDPDNAYRFIARGAKTIDIIKTAIDCLLSTTTSSGVL